MLEEVLPKADASLPRVMPLRQPSWASIPLRSFALFLAAVFFTFAPVGFLADIIDRGANSPRRLLAHVLFAACTALAYVMAMRRPRRYMPIVAAVHITLSLMYQRIIPAPGSPLTDDALAARLQFDALAAGAAIILGYILFTTFVRREGERYFRAHTEIALAREIHRLLVPTIEQRIGRFEFYGVSIPSGDVGGDLVDVVERDGHWVGFIADVSGHGVGAGVLMGMVKSAARMKLAASASIGELFGDLNRVLIPLRKPGMFVTMACLRNDGSPELELSLAGHLPILQYCAATTLIEERTISHVAVALFDDQDFSSVRVPFAAGDLFVLLTDGLTEVFDARDRELGLEPIKQIVRDGASRPLAALAESIVAAARRHGRQLDDQTLLIVRVT
jgi:serine phosphatase RsbU (regulator of sigma subunit)